MIERLSRTRRNLVLLALGLLVAWFSWRLRSVINPLLFGYLLAYILLPLVNSLERRGQSRRSAVNLIFIGGFVLASLVGLALFTQLRALTVDLVKSAKEVATAQPGQGVPLYEGLQHRVDEFTSTLNSWGFEVERWQVPDLEGLRDLAQSYLEQYGEETGRKGLSVAGKSLGFFADVVGGLLNVLGLLFLVPLYTYYFLFVIGDMHVAVQRYFPRRERERLSRIFDRIGEVLASFFRGRLAVAFGKGLLMALGLTALDVPYGFLFGMLSGAFSIIPFIGAFVGFVLALIAAMLDHGVIGGAWRAALVCGAGELIEGYVLVPRILGNKLGLHPLVVFFALVAGGAAGGMFGILVSLPATATLVILFQELVAPALRQFADETV